MVLAPVFVTMALIGGALPSFSRGAYLYALMAGGGMFWIGLSGRVAKWPSPVELQRGVVWWLLPVGVLVVLELVNFSYGSTYAHPTFSLLADPILDGYLARSVAYLIWLSGFWGLVRR